MFCGNCGKKLNDDARFCNGCGCAVGQSASGGSQPNVCMKKPSGGKLPLVIGICAAAAVVAVLSVALLAKFRSNDKDSDVAINKIEKEADADRSNNKVGKNMDAADNKAEEVAVAESSLDDVQNNDTGVAESDSNRVVEIKDEQEAWRKESQSKLKGKSARIDYIDALNGVVSDEDYYLCSAKFVMPSWDRNFLSGVYAMGYVEVEHFSDVRNITNVEFTKGYLETYNGETIDCCIVYATVDEYGEELLSLFRLFPLNNDVVEGFKNLYLTYYVLPVYLVDQATNIELLQTLFSTAMSAELLTADYIAKLQVNYPSELSVDFKSDDWDGWTIVCSGSIFSIKTNGFLHNFQIDFNEDSTVITGVSYVGSTPRVYTHIGDNVN